MRQDKRCIYFDIDRTLIDSVKIRELTRARMCGETGLRRNQLNQVIEEYVSTLAHKNDYRREKMINFVSEKTGIKYAALKQAHDRPENYSEALYPEVAKALERLKKVGEVLGIYSEGFVRYQTDKLVLSGIIRYFETDKVVIVKRKLREKVVKQLDAAVVVDDSREVIEYLKNFKEITPIWLNRINKENMDGVRTIYNLDELPDAID